MKTAYVALGSNLGDREKNLSRAAAALTLLPGTGLSAVSYIYETDPVGYTDQDCFLNAAVKIKTSLSPRALLGAMLGIEAAMGRVRTVKNGPRVIDLDLLLYDGETSNDAELTLPHPRICERAFVLVPLLDVCDDEKYRAALSAVGRDGVRPTGKKITV